KSRT
ncbi:phenazine biosynthesis, PhzF family protein, partial [Vibrio parahaemolyticus IDH02189]